MRTYLSFSWNTGMAIGELTAAAFFVLALLMIQHLVRYKMMASTAWTVPLLIALSILVAATLGWVVGSSAFSQGYGLGLITPLSAILQAVHYNRYSALGFLIGFQMLGSVIGLGAFSLMRLVLPRASSLASDLAPLQYSYATSIIKSVVFQPLLIAALLLIPSLDLTAYDSGIVLNALLLALSIGLLMFLSQWVNYIIFSPLIAIILWAEALVTRTMRWGRFYSEALEIALQLLVAVPIVAGDVLNRINRGIY